MLPNPFDFSGKVAVITGGATGIGAAIATAMAQGGARIVIAARNLDRLEERAATIRAETGAAVEAIATDVTDEEQCRDLIAKTVERFGRIDILVNNAGGGRHAPIRKFRTDKWRQEFDLNMHSAFYCAQAAFPHMEAQGGGNIINISSMAGMHGTMGVSAYSAAKAGLQMFTRVAAAEWGPRGIRVNAVACGMIATELAKANWAKTGFDGTGAANVFPLRRPGTPEDVAGAVLFFASDISSYVTGEVLSVAGGPTLKGMIDI